MTRKPKSGDYVLATKYSDGDPGDNFCVGYYDREITVGSEIRHLVVDNHGDQLRHNGFRRVARISSKRGTWILKNLPLVESSHFNVWHWLRVSWGDLSAIATLKE